MELRDYGGITKITRLCLHAEIFNETFLFHLFMLFYSRTFFFLSTLNADNVALIKRRAKLCKT